MAGSSAIFVQQHQLPGTFEDTPHILEAAAPFSSMLARFAREQLTHPCSATIGGGGEGEPC